jgi:hypothetical protein
VIKAFRVGDHLDEELLKAYDVHAYLLDTFVDGREGGPVRRSTGTSPAGKKL